MKFDIGDDVKLKVNKSYEDGVTIPKGTRGLVEKVYPLSESYLVSFDGFEKSRRVLEDDLTKP
jgi:ribosomal protein L21E